MDIQLNDNLRFPRVGEAEVFRNNLLILRCSYRRSLGKKAEALPAGAHWITMHPPGNEEHGVPIIVRDNPDGSSSVIGGAGGKLNHLRLKTHPEKWKASAKARQLKKREKEEKRVAAQSEGDRSTEKSQKEQLKEHHQSKKQQNALETLDTLGEHGIEHGLTDDHKNALSAAPAPNATPEETKQRQQLSIEAIKKVKAIHEAYEHHLVVSHDNQAAAILGDGENHLVQGQTHAATGADGNAIANLQHLPNGQWLASSTDDEPPQAFNSWKDAAKAHVRNVLAAEQDVSEGDRTQPDSFYDPSQWVKPPDSEIAINPEAAAKIAALSAKRRALNRSAKDAEKEIENGSAFSQEEYDAPTKAVTEQSAIEGLEQEAKTIQDAIVNNDFLKLIDKGDAKQLRPAVATGGYAQLAEIASEVLKQNPIARGLVDAIGHNEAAKVLAHQIRNAVPPDEYDRIVKAQSAYHALTSTRIAKAATSQAKPMLAQMGVMHQRMLELADEGGDRYTPEQQIELDNLTYQSASLNSTIQKLLGETAGKLQASAAMVAALEAKPKSLRIPGDAEGILPEPNLSNQQVSEGDGEAKQSLFDRYGLTNQDYKLDEYGQIQVSESGMDKLAVGYSPEDKAAYDEAVAIKRGDRDEAEYVPAGFARRSPASFSNATNESAQFDVKLDLKEGMAKGDIKNSLKSYIGSRVANGEDPLAVMTDVRSPELYLSQGLDPYGKLALDVQGAANEMVVEAGGEGGKISDRAIRDSFQSLGDSEAASQRKARQTDDLDTLHAQKLDSETAIEAAHRSLAAMPMARVAFKEWGDLSGKEKKWLRDYAITDVLGQELAEPVKSSGKKEETEPEEEMQADLFGGFVSAAEVAQGQKGEDKQFSQWQNFSKLMGGDQKAYDAVRDRLRGQFMNRFASAYGSIGDKPLLVGGQTMKNIDRLLLAKMPEDQRSEMLEFIRSRDSSDTAKARSRSGGKFSRELDSEWLNKYEDIKGDNRQISLLQSDTGRSQDKTDYQRTTLGDAAESQLEGLLRDRVIPNFNQINSPVSIFPTNWNGGTDHVTKQRALKFLESRKKFGLNFQAGSGKSSIMLGCFSHLQAQGKIKKAVFAVPSSIVGQFVGEAATFLEAGKYKYNANMGMSQEERINALSDPDLDFHVTTRESLANDLLYLVKKHEGKEYEEFSQLPEDEQRSLFVSALKKQGIDPESMMLAVDESHDLLSRGEGVSSRRSLGLHTLGYHTPYYIQSTGSPIKNSLDEMYSFLHSVAPEKFNDLKSFKQQYGGDSVTSRRALQRAIAPYSYAAGTRPKDGNGRVLQMNEHQPKIAPSKEIAGERQRILDDTKTIGAYLRSRSEELKESGNAEIQSSDFNDAFNHPEVKEAIERLASPETWGKLTDEQKKEAIGGQVRAVGALKQLAFFRLFQNAPFKDNPKAQWTVDLAKKMQKEGKPGVVFSQSTKAAGMLQEAMKKQGLRVGYIDGSMNSQQKQAEQLKFQGDNAYDVLVVTDSCATGVNLTAGKYLVHFDCPQTAKNYEQRSARIHRLKQTQDTDVYVPQLDLPEERINWARVQRKGAIAQPLQSKAELLDDSGLAAEIERQRKIA